MKQYRDQQIINCSPMLAKEVVLDIESYPEFIPWCKEAKIIEKNEKYFIGELKISFKHFSEKYQSKITLVEEDNGVFVINVVAISGPFRVLNNIWRISSAMPEQSIIGFEIEFELENKMMDIIFGAIFKQAIEKITQAFVKRIKSLAK